MRNLPIPKTNNKQKLAKIVSSKNKPYKGRLVRIRSRVKSRYDDYDHHANVLENITASEITGVCSDALVKCYTSKTEEMAALRDELLYPDLEDFDECPFCGIGEPKTLDHYLPKEEFPEFSVLSKNLIPVCGVCNSNYKGRNWIENGNRLFLHTYYDLFPDEYLFEASVTVTNEVAIEFSTKFIATESYFCNIFSNHFDKLHLNKRYKRKASAEIKRKRRSLELIYRRNNSANDVAMSLREEANGLEIDYSKNHWKPVLYRALSKSVSFCDAGFRKQVIA
ncbi:hypothetical protein OTK51_04450 [Vibrio scophthalmi]|uniref:hypothetical protein n=1 Tax=Vibrio scophthalmi TaxID=45658 RepID=UPI0022840F08|nr:hypothetical protein [Vibrio scophthalmi]MCY9802678.1 hypothetical protein [Vibrio scophthalmi]